MLFSGVNDKLTTQNQKQNCSIVTSQSQTLELNQHCNIRQQHISEQQFKRISCIVLVQVALYETTIPGCL